MFAAAGFVVGPARVNPRALRMAASSENGTGPIIALGVDIGPIPFSAAKAKRGQLWDHLHYSSRVTILFDLVGIAKRESFDNRKSFEEQEQQSGTRVAQQLTKQELPQRTM